MSTVPLITYACKVPSGVPSPVRDDATSNLASVTLTWTEPIFNGGCPITGYALFRSEPTLYNSVTDTETFVEANTDNDQNIRN